MLASTTTFNRTTTLTSILGLGGLLLLALAAQVQTALGASEPAVFSTREGAIRGYDPVAYFTESRAVKGKSEFTHTYNGAQWQFANQKHLELFKADPAKYAPQYGGYCAFAMSKGSHASTDPKAWTIHDDKLYLNYSISIRSTWSKNIDSHIRKANQNWQRFHGS